MRDHQRPHARTHASVCALAASDERRPADAVGVPRSNSWRLASWHSCAPEVGSTAEAAAVEQIVEAWARGLAEKGRPLLSREMAAARDAARTDVMRPGRTAVGCITSRPAGTRYWHAKRLDCSYNRFRARPSGG